MNTTPTGSRSPLADAAGYSLVEMMVAMGITTVIMTATMTGLADVSKGSEMVLNMTAMNKALRSGMDLLERDMLQVGSGLPPGHVILVPSGAGSSPVKIPGPPGTAFIQAAGDPDISAVLPSPGLGPSVNGHATDVLTVLMADNTFLNITVTAVALTSVDVSAVVAGQAVNIATGPDRVSPGQLMMISKGSSTTLVEITAVDTATRRLTFSNGDSLNLNQSGAAAGNMAAINALAPVNSPNGVQLTRIRMITYYLDATIDPKHPRLVRRINNGHPTNFDNTSGTAVAMDIENLTFNYDLNDGNTNPSNVRMTAADIGGTGACAPNPCSTNQIRKVDVLITARSSNVNNPKARSFHNTLASQVSFRGMAFVDEYK
jgi:Prokaryotic N-terminal methylation motif